MQSQTTSDDEQISSSTTSKSEKPFAKHSYGLETSPTTDLSNDKIEIDDDCDEDDQSTTRKYNFSMSVDELSDMQKEVNDFCNEDDYDSDSSSSQKLRALILGKKPETDSDEESLSDDDTPHGWKNNQEK